MTLEAERDFLLRSIDDLDAELEAGDLDPADHETLKAEYTARAAAVIRQLDELPAAPPAPDAAPDRRPWIRRLSWVGGIVVLAVVAGVLVAQASGSRRGGETFSGDIRQTTRQLLFDAQQAFGAGDVEDAISIYDEVLDQQPTNVEALTYQAWLSSRSGADPSEALAQLDDAIALDPAYADARVFAAIVALDEGDAETAAGHLEMFESLDPPPFAQQLVVNAQLRERIALARVEPLLLTGDPRPVGETDLTTDDVVLAAEALAVEGRFTDGLVLFDLLQAEFPDDAGVIAARGWFLARAGSSDERAAELLDQGLAYLDDAVLLDPSSAEALVYRAFTRNELGDIEGARADLAAYDALSERPIELEELIDRARLRALLSSTTG